MRASILVCVAALASCHRPTPTIAPTISAPASKPVAHAEVSPVGIIVGSLVPIPAGATAIDVEDRGPAIDACKAAGWPATLPNPIARALPQQGIGTHATVVHPGGLATVIVDGIECQAPGDIEG